MKNNIKISEFVKLCSALEKKIITKSQYKKLSDTASSDNVDAILKIMEADYLYDKFEVFDRLILSDNVLFFLKCLNDREIYRVDHHRQKVLIDNIDNPLIANLAPLLEYDWYFNDEELRQQLLSMGDEDINEHTQRSFCQSVNKVLEHINKNSELYENENVQKISKLAFKPRIRPQLFYFLNYLEIDELTKRPIWFEYLEKYYDKDQRYFPHHNDFNKLKDYNRLDMVMEKFDELVSLEETDSVKSLKYNSLLDNISTLAVEYYLDEYSESIYEFLIDFILDKDCFEKAHRLIELGYDNKSDIVSDKVISFWHNELKKIKNDQVRVIVFESIFENDDLASVELIGKLTKSSSNEAMVLLVSRAIEINDKKYIDMCHKYCRRCFSDILPTNLTAYLNSHDLTTDELIALKNKILDKSLMVSEDIWAIDFEDVIPAKEEILEEVPSIEEKSSLKTLSKVKTYIKSFINKRAI